MGLRSRGKLDGPMPKSPAQLDREIAEVLSRTPGKRLSHATMATIGRSWESPQGRRVVVAEEGDRVAIKTGDSTRYELLPKRELDREIVLDEDRAASARKRAGAKEAASALEERQATERADDSGFTASMSDVSRQRALTVLNTRQGFNGVLRQRKEALRDMVTSGYRVEGTGKDRRLTSPDGRFLTVGDITKTGMDFADHLASLK